MAEIEGVVIEVGDGLVSSVWQQLSAVKDDKPENFTIFRVPAHVRGSNKRLYEPQLVSIGPYHHGNPAFKAMQMYKWQYLRDVLARGRRSCVEGCVRCSCVEGCISGRCSCIEDCISMLRTLAPRAQQCYFDPVELDVDEFVKMLLLDGCFILEFLMKYSLDKKKDAVCNIAWSLPLIRCDLLLLDNQIPFFIMESLFDLLGKRLAAADLARCGISSLMELLVAYITKGERKELPAVPGKKIHHLLHVQHLCFVPAKYPNSSTAGNSAGCSLLPRFCRSKKGKKRLPRTIPCATELQDAGVTFTKKKEADSSGSLLDITFQNGALAALMQRNK